MEILKLVDITLKFGDNEVTKNFNLSVNSGEIIAITGPSGRGKTSLMNIMGLLQSCESGDVILFQNFALIDNETVKQNLEIPFEDQISNQYMVETLKKVGLSGEYLDKYIYTLSGGEQQRIAIARLFIKKCDLILADEPRGH